MSITNKKSLARFNAQTRAELQLLKEKLSLFLYSLEFNKAKIAKWLNFILEVGLTEFSEESELFLVISFKKKSKNYGVFLEIYSIRAESYIQKARKLFNEVSVKKITDTKIPYLQIFIAIQNTDFYPDSNFINLSKLMLSQLSTNEMVQEMKEKNDILINKVRQLESENEKIKENLDSRSMHLAYLSHEIRTPMNGILGFTSMLLKEELTQKQYEYLRKIRNSGNDLINIVNDILDFSKIEANRMIVENVSFDILFIMEEIKELFEEQAESKGLNFSIELITKGNNRLFGDSFRIKQVLMNLTSNAIKFTKKGGISIKVELLKKLERSVHYLFKVTDTGIGIRESAIKKLFSPFTQADNSISRKFGGTGLGLFISKTIVEMMGGEISVSSVPAEGTSFSFVLPLVIDLWKADKIENIDFRGCKALVVDSYQNSNLVISTILRRYGFICETESFGDHAFDNLKNRHNKKQDFDLVIIDYNMPFGVNGGQLAEKIKKDPSFSNSFVILMGIYNQDDELYLYNKYIDAYLKKPVSEVVLIDTIKQLFFEKYHDYRKTLNKSDILKFKEKLGNIKILLAEDNIINQEVVNELLSGLGINLIIVDNGEEAIEWTLKENFDLLLMDINMPVKNGFEAFEVIKEMTKDIHLPVIAMIANIDDKEKCLNTGFSDFIMKPFKPEDLYNVIYRWLIKSQSIDFKLEKNAKQDINRGHLEIDSIHFDLSEIDTNEGLKRVEGKTDVYIKLLKNFRKTFLNFANKINIEITEGNFPKAKNLAHTLKGASGTIGAYKLYRIAYEFENYLSENRIPEKPKELFFLELEKVLENLSVIDELETKNHEGDPGNVSIDNEKFVKDLVQLNIALNTDVGKALDLIEQYNLNYSTSVYSKTIYELDNLINDFRIEEAKKSLDTLLRSIE